MPTYAYACKNCGHRFEQYQSFSEDSLTVCPNCGEPTLRKVFDSVGVVFKGSGFYSTDAKTSGANSVGGSGEKGSTGSSEKSSSESSGSSSGSSTGGSSAGSSSSTGSSSSGSAQAASS